jgi:uncharacterized protein
MDKSIISGAIDYVRSLLGEETTGHDAEHALRVCRNALRIAESEPGCDREITALAALLHDADDHKLFQTENNENARRFLAASGVPAETIDRICAVINSVSFSRNRGRTPETVEGRVVQDADRLDALGAVGIARTFAYGGARGRPLEESVQHFYDKLLLLKDLMNTEAGRQMAEERDAFLRSFLEQLFRETDGTGAEDRENGREGERGLWL